MAKEAPKPRYVIKGKDPITGNTGYFTEFEPSYSQVVTLNGVYVGTEMYKIPRFLGPSPLWGAKYDTEADALDHVKTGVDKFHGGPAAFEGCTVESTWE